MRLPALVLLTGLSTLTLTATLPAQTTAPVLKEALTEEHLAALDTFHAQIEDSKDNFYLHQQQRAEYVQAMNKLLGSNLNWPATVVRVNRNTVDLRHSQYGRSRIVMIHFKGDGSHSYNNLNFTPPRCVTPSAYRYARHAGMPAVEIGVEIPLELAKTLRAGDLVQLSGNVEHVDTRLTRGNGPDTLIYVANIKAARYLTQEERDLLADE